MNDIRDARGNAINLVRHARPRSAALDGDGLALVSPIRAISPLAHVYLQSP